MLVIYSYMCAHAIYVLWPHIIQFHNNHNQYYYYYIFVSEAMSIYVVRVIIYYLVLI